MNIKFIFLICDSWQH